MNSVIFQVILSGHWCMLVASMCQLKEKEDSAEEKRQRDIISTISDSQPWFIPSNRGPSGAGRWMLVSETGSLLSWSHQYERGLTSRPGQIKKEKSCRWSTGIKKDSQLDLTKNRFPLYAAALILPAMQGFDERRRGVDLLNRDFIVLGKQIHMLSVCMKCTAMPPEASASCTLFFILLLKTPGPWILSF